MIPVFIKNWVCYWVLWAWVLFISLLASEAELVPRLPSNDEKEKKKIIKKKTKTKKQDEELGKSLLLDEITEDGERRDPLVSKEKVQVICIEPQIFEDKQPLLSDEPLIEIEESDSEGEQEYFKGLFTLGNLHKETRSTDSCSPVMGLNQECQRDHLEDEDVEDYTGQDEDDDEPDRDVPWIGVGRGMGLTRYSGVQNLLEHADVEEQPVTKRFPQTVLPRREGPLMLPRSSLIKNLSIEKDRLEEIPEEDRQLSPKKDDCSFSSSDKIWEQLVAKYGEETNRDASYKPLAQECIRDQNVPKKTVRVIENMSEENMTAEEFTAQVGRRLQSYLDGIVEDTKNDKSRSPVENINDETRTIDDEVPEEFDMEDNGHNRIFILIEDDDSNGDKEEYQKVSTALEEIRPEDENELNQIYELLDTSDKEMRDDSIIIVDDFDLESKKNVMTVGKHTPFTEEKYEIESKEMENKEEIYEIENYKKLNTSSPQENIYVCQKHFDEDILTPLEEETKRLTVSKMISSEEKDLRSDILHIGNAKEASDLGEIQTTTTSDKSDLQTVSQNVDLDTFGIQEHNDNVDINDIKETEQADHKGSYVPVEITSPDEEEATPVFTIKLKKLCKPKITEKPEFFSVKEQKQKLVEDLKPLIREELTCKLNEIDESQQHLPSDLKGEMAKNAKLGLEDSKSVVVNETYSDDVTAVTITLPFFKKKRENNTAGAESVSKTNDKFQLRSFSDNQKDSAQISLHSNDQKYLPKEVKNSEKLKAEEKISSDVVEEVDEKYISKRRSSRDMWKSECDKLLDGDSKRKIEPRELDVFCTRYEEFPEDYAAQDEATVPLEHKSITNNNLKEDVENIYEKVYGRREEMTETVQHGTKNDTESVRNTLDTETLCENFVERSNYLCKENETADDTDFHEKENKHVSEFTMNINFKCNRENKPQEKNKTDKNILNQAQEMSDSKTYLWCDEDADKENCLTAAVTFNDDVNEKEPFLISSAYEDVNKNGKENWTGEVSIAHGETDRTEGFADFRRFPDSAYEDTELLNKGAHLADEKITDVAAKAVELNEARDGESLNVTESVRKKLDLDDKSLEEKIDIQKICETNFSKKLKDSLDEIDMQNRKLSLDYEATGDPEIMTSSVSDQLINVSSLLTISEQNLVARILAQKSKEEQEEESYACKIKNDVESVLAVKPLLSLSDLHKDMSHENAQGEIDFSEKLKTFCDDVGISFKKVELRSDSNNLDMFETAIPEQDGSLSKDLTEKELILDLIRKERKQERLSEEDIPEYLDEVKDLLVPRARRKKAKKRLTYIDDILRVEETELDAKPKFFALSEENDEVEAIPRKEFDGKQDVEASKDTTDLKGKFLLTEEEEKELEAIKIEQEAYKAAQRRELEKFLSMPAALTEQEHQELEELLAEEDTDKESMTKSEARLEALLREVRKRIEEFGINVDEDDLEHFMTLPTGLTVEEELLLCSEEEKGMGDFNSEEEYREYIKQRYLNQLEEEKLRVEEEEYEFGEYYDDEYEYEDDLEYDEEIEGEYVVMDDEDDVRTSERVGATGEKAVITKDEAVGSDQPMDFDEERPKEMKKFFSISSLKSKGSSKGSRSSLDRQSSRDSSHEGSLGEDSKEFKQSKKFFRFGSLGSVRKKKRQQIIQLDKENEVEPLSNATEQKEMQRIETDLSNYSNYSQKDVFKKHRLLLLLKAIYKYDKNQRNIFMDFNKSPEGFVNTKNNMKIGDNHYNGNQQLKLRGNINKKTMSNNEMTNLEERESHVDCQETQNGKQLLNYNEGHKTEHRTKEQISEKCNQIQITDICNEEKISENCNDQISKNCIEEEISDNCNENQIATNCIEEEISENCNENKISKNYIEEEISRNCNENQTSKNCIEKEISENCNRNQQSKNCIEEEISENCNENQLSKTCNEEEISENYNENQIFKNCIEEEISENCNENQIFKNCIEDEISENCNESQLSKHCIEEKLSENCNENQISKHCIEDEISENCNENQLSKNCIEEEVSENCNEIQIFKKIIEEEISENCNENQISQNCIEEEISENCNENQISKNCIEEEISENCNENQIFQKIIEEEISENCNENQISKNCFEDEISENCNGNQISKNCIEDEISEDCNENQLSKNCVEEEISENCNENQISKHCIDEEISENCNENQISKKKVIEEEEISENCNENQISKNIKEQIPENYGDKNRSSYFLSDVDGTSDIEEQFVKKSGSLCQKNYCSDKSSENYSNFPGKRQNGERSKDTLEAEILIENKADASPDAFHVPEKNNIQTDFPCNKSIEECQTLENTEDGLNAEDNLYVEINGKTIRNFIPNQNAQVAPVLHDAQTNEDAHNLQNTVNAQSGKTKIALPRSSNGLKVENDHKGSTMSRKGGSRLATAKGGVAEPEDEELWPKESRSSKVELDEFQKMEQEVALDMENEKKKREGDKKGKKKRKKKGESEKENKKTPIQNKDALNEKHVGPRIRSFDTAKMKSKFSKPKEPTQLSSECHICGKQVFQMEKIIAEKASWHKNCFRCKECNKNLTLETYQSHEGSLYCKPHFKELFRPKAVIQDEAEERKERLMRRPRMIVLESQPEALPEDVVRATQKPDYGLEELQQTLNMKERFAVFENLTKEAERPKAEPISVRRSQSLMSKAAKFLDGHEDSPCGDADGEYDDEDEEEGEGEGEGEEEGEEDGDDSIVRSNKRKKERPMSFSGMGDLKAAWEQKQRREEMSQSRKEEISRFRQMLCAGKNSTLKERFESGRFQDEDEDPQKIKEQIRIEAKRAASTLKKRFEQGEPFIIEDEDEESAEEEFTDEEEEGEEEDEDGAPKKSRRRRNRITSEQQEVEEIFKEAETAKKARNVFKQIDSKVAQEGAPVLRSHTFATSNLENRRSLDASLLMRQSSIGNSEVVKSGEKSEDFHVDTTDLASRFKFFLNYEKEQEKEREKPRKVFRITPPREGVYQDMQGDDLDVLGRDPNLIKCTDNYQDEIDCRNTKNILQMFKKMEMGNDEEEEEGPRPLKQFTPPPDGGEYDESDEEYSDGDYSDEEEEEDEEDEEGNKRPEIKDEILEMENHSQSARKAASLRAKFERWEAEVVLQNDINKDKDNLDDCVPSIDSAKNLKAMFEHKANEVAKPVASKPITQKVNRFV